MSNQQTIYVVTQGEYSDYGIVAMFTRRKKAQDFCRLHNTRKENGEDVTLEDGAYAYSPDYSIEEWELDPDVPEVPKGRQGYQVFMSRDGETTVVRPRSIVAVQDHTTINFYSSVQGRTHFHPNRDESMAGADRLNQVPFMTVSVLARDETHAVKITSEKRGQILALNRWPEEYNNWGNAELEGF